MKKISFAVCCMFLTAALFAQVEVAPKSLESEVTSGTFENEIDRGFKASPSFGLYEQQFIYGGIAGNPNKKAFNTTPINELNFGYYAPIFMPMSFYTGFKGTAFGTGLKYTDGPEYTYEDDTHKKVIATKHTAYPVRFVFSDYTLKTQYLIRIGGANNMVTGFYLSYHNTKGLNSAEVLERFKHESYTHTTLKHLNYTSKAYNVKSASLKAGIQRNGFALNPTSIVRYDMSAEKLGDEKDFTHEATIGFPFAFTTGNLEHNTEVIVESKITASNSSFYEKTDHHDNDISYRRNYYGSDTTLTLKYGLTMPASDREQEEDAWEFGGDIKIIFKNVDGSFSYKDKLSKTDFSYMLHRNPNFRFGLNGTAGRLLVFPSPKKTFVFKLKPQIDLGFVTGSPNSSGIGRNISAKGKIGGKDFAYTLKESGRDWNNTTTMTAIVSSAMGLKIMPEGWKVGFMMGAEPKMTCTLNTSSDGLNNNHKHSIKEELNAGDASFKHSKEEYVDGRIVDKTVKADTDWKFEEKHSIGFTIPFEGGAHLDFKLNGSNITAIEAFTAQVFIPLGVPKSKRNNE